MSRKMDGGFINYQDFKPVVLTKPKTFNNGGGTPKSNTNIHIKPKNEFDTNSLEYLVTFLCLGYELKLSYFYSDELHGLYN